MTVLIPTGVEGFTTEWLTAVFEPSFPGVQIRQVRPLGRSDGSAARVRLAIDSVGNADAPRSVVIKAAFTANLGNDELAKVWIPLMAMMHETESQWYTELAAPLGDRSPRCYYAATSGHDAVIVLEDLNTRQGIRFGAYNTPLEPDDMASVLDVLAAVHAIRWDDQSFVAEPLRDSFLAGGMLDGFLSETNWEQQLSRPRATRMPVELMDYRLCTTAIRQAWDAKHRGPQSFIHGDPHVGNHFFDSKGAGLLDWQLLTSGHWASDVVYAIASSMEIEKRRTYEQALLAHYLGTLRSLVGVAPSQTEAWHDYRKFAIWGVASVLTPGDGVQTEDYLTIVSERHAQAAIDLESVALLGAE
ncbi:aminoglycoside phosphotransferase [Mycobacteroides abscessus]|nr:aminoglycoside phosphotransferase [Mycobacteroides abscessus]CPS45371.1 aminoglycoside phosphotransferase [Mycobacteroides abscessus]CPS54415.1 aminoglycoside phosphotransferase [Mycobacteroides abscessus]CPT37050.1 aminoglycoside phosphotransferase [Mycobacteroides abscessus]CPT64171.1 aminoglycoside phosphotransferase [Mycobacteroides abscessus]